jgi:hypothetical protein
MNLESSAPPVHRAIFGQTILVSSSLLRHYDETKTLLCSIPHICLIGADGEQLLAFGKRCGSAQRRDHPLIQHRRLKLFKKDILGWVAINAG